MTKGYNLWLEWEAYKMRHPEERQVLEWQERYYQQSGQLLKKGAKHSGKEETYKTSIGV